MGLAQILGGISRTTQKSSGTPTAARATGLDKLRQNVNATLAQWAQFKTRDVAQLNTRLPKARLPEVKPLAEQASIEPTGG